MKLLFQLPEKLAYLLALVGFAGLLMLAMMVVADIVLRAVADYPLQGVNDVAAVIMAVVVSACIPNALLVRQNISIEVLGQVIGGRIRHLIDLFASLVVLLFFVLVAWQFVHFSASISASGEQTWVLKWPVGPWWWAATACFFVSVLVQVLVVSQDVARLLGLDVRFQTHTELRG